jgi:hypothetical protein
MSDTFGNIINGAAGTAQGREGTTIQTFVISLAAGFVLFATQFGAFLITELPLGKANISAKIFLDPIEGQSQTTTEQSFKMALGVAQDLERPSPA